MNVPSQDQTLGSTGYLGNTPRPEFHSHFMEGDFEFVCILVLFCFYDQNISHFPKECTYGSYCLFSRINKLSEWEVFI